MEDNIRAMGYIPSTKDIRDYHINRKVCSNFALPAAFEVKHSSIKDQGIVGSCVAHATTEVLESLVYNKLNYSTAWIYGYRPVGYYQGKGMMTNEALKTICQVGAVQQVKFPGNIEMPQAKELVNSELDKLKELASHDKITSYARLRTLQEIKEAIYTSGKPIIICISCGPTIELDKNYIAQIPEKVTSGHAVVCYGWNETGLLIQNSWGTWWGDKGCFILPYEYPFNEAWILTRNKDLIVKPSVFELREFLVHLLRLIKLLLKGIVRKI